MRPRPKRHDLGPALRRNPRVRRRGPCRHYGSVLQPAPRSEKRPRVESGPARLPRMSSEEGVTATRRAFMRCLARGRLAAFRGRPDGREESSLQEARGARRALPVAHPWVVARPCPPARNGREGRALLRARRRCVSASCGECIDRTLLGLDGCRREARNDDRSIRASGRLLGCDCEEHIGRRPGRLRSAPPHLALVVRSRQAYASSWPIVCNLDGHRSAIVGHRRAAMDRDGVGHR